ncbi:unnamed protein product, partial [Scytosiphon promiscuus]
MPTSDPEAVVVRRPAHMCRNPDNGQIHGCDMLRTTREFCSAFRRVFFAVWALLDGRVLYLCASCPACGCQLRYTPHIKLRFYHLSFFAPATGGRVSFGVHRPHPR